MKIMKKLLLMALAFHFIACTNENANDAAPAATAVNKENQFKAAPEPIDYLKAQHPQFMELNKELEKVQTSLTAKKASWVSTYVPDAAFRTALINLGAAQDASPGDSYIEIDNTRGGLYLTSAGITDLTGINSFTSLIQLSVSGNNLTSLNISGLTNLKRLECQYNQITTLNLTANTQLSEIWCYSNALTSLTIPSSASLWGVWCYSNQLTTLNLNGNIGITSLFIQGNQLTSFNFAPYVNLTLTNVSSNKWTTVNFDSNTKLTMLQCYSNTLLTDLYMRSTTANTINSQNFSGNKFGLKIHVNSIFLPSATTLWPNYGTATYML